MAVHKWKNDFKCNQINELDELRGKKYTDLLIHITMSMCCICGPLRV